MIKRVAITICLLILGPVTILATVISSANGGGNWTATGSWSPAQVPGASDTVIVTSSNPITVNTSVSATSITVNTSATLTNNGSITVSKVVSASGSFTGTGAIVFSGTGMTVTDNSYITCTGSITVTGDMTIASGSVIYKQGTWVLSSSAVVTNNGSVSVLGSSGYVNLGSSSTWTNASNSTLTVSYSFTGTGTLDASGSGNTVNYYQNATNIYVASPAYHHLALHQSSTKNLAGNITVNGDFSLNSSSYLNGQNYTITLKGNWSDWIAVAGSVSNTSITFTGTGTQTIIKSSVIAENFVHFTLNCTGTVLLATPVSISDDLVFTSGTFDVSTSNWYVACYGNWTHNGGTFTPRSGLVYFQPSSGQSKTITSSSGAETFYKITKQNPGTNTFQCDVHVSNLFTLAAGTWVSGSGGDTMTLQNNWSNTGGTFTPGSSVVIFKGSGAQSVSRTSGTETFHHLSKTTNITLTLNPVVSCSGNVTVSSGTLTLGNTLTVTGNVSISGSTTLNSNNKNIEVAGNWTNSGTFTVGTGFVTLNGTGTQTISKPGSTETFKKLKLSKSNTSGVTFSSPVIVTDTLDLTEGIITTTSSNYLKINDNGYARNGSDSGYITGPMRKVGNDVFIFPLGGITASVKYYHPLNITAPGSVSDEFSAEYFPTNQAYGTPIDDSLIMISRSEYWLLNRLAGSTNVKVGLGWNANSMNSDNTEEMVVTYWDGAKWVNAGQGSIVINANKGVVNSNISIPLTTPPLAIGWGNPPQYAHLERKVGGGFYPAKTQLKFIYEEEYRDADGKLSYEVIKEDGTVVMTGTTNPKNTAYGYNGITIAISSLTTNTNYTLVVKNEKGENWKLRFKKVP